MENWLDRGGAYWVLGVGWLAAIVLGFAGGLALGKRLGAQGDGCLLAGQNAILSLVGGMLGLLAPGRASLAGALGGAVLLPALATLVWALRTRAHR